MKRPLIAFVLVLAAAAAQAEARSPIGGATMPRDPLQADPLGPRSEPTVTVAQAVARTQIEHSGYSGVRNLSRTADGTWRGVARMPATPVASRSQPGGAVKETPDPDHRGNRLARPRRGGASC
jgi:hypothetical protein